MKNLVSLILSIAIFTFISSCASDPSEMIVGEWQITDVQTTSEIPDDQMDMYKEQIEEMKKSSKVVYKEDGTIEQTILDETSTGTWTISEDGKTLTTEIDGNKEVKKIQELTPEKMVLVLEFDNNKTITSFKKVK